MKVILLGMKIVTEKKMSKFRIGDKVKVHDRKMKVHTFSGKITGIESNTDNPVYNVMIELEVLDKKTDTTKKSGQKRSINLLESQITEEVKIV